MGKRKSFRFEWLDAFVEHAADCPYLRSLAYSLNYHMDEKGTCYPGHRRLAKVSGMTRPSVRKYLDVLEKSGWIVINKTAKSTRGGYVDGYQAVKPVDLLEHQSGKSGFPLNDKKRPTEFATKDSEAVNGESLSGKNQRSKRPTPFAKTIEQQNINKEFPDWLNLSAWKEFEHHRIDIKKPLSKSASKKCLTILEKHKDQQQEIIDATIVSGWAGLYPPKRKANHSDKNSTTRFAL